MRRGRIRLLVACFSALVALSELASGCAHPCAFEFAPEQAMSALKEGNERFACGRPIHPNSGVERRQATLLQGQHPIAVIVACSDSRVPVELVFDRGIGDLFVIRVAGNVCGEDELGSIEYATEHLDAKLVVVLGHSGCGAVSAVVNEAHEHGNVDRLLRHIMPVVATLRRAHPELSGEALLRAAVAQNVRKTMADALANSEELRSRVNQGKVMLEGAVYDLESARVEWIGASMELPPGHS